MINMTEIQKCINDLEEGQIDLSKIINRCLKISYSLGDVYSFIECKLELTNTQEYMQKDNIYNLALEFIKTNSLNEDNLKEKFDLAVKIYKKRRVHNVASGSITYFQSLREYEDHIHEIESAMGYDAVKDKDKLMYQKKLKSIIRMTYEYFYEKLITWVNNMENSKQLNRVEHIKSKNVFIIHGHNAEKWRELEKLLKERFNLNPIVLQEQSNGGSSIIFEKFEREATTCCFAIALCTPDDIIDKNGRRYTQPRPNVIFEIGWFTAKLGRERVLMLVQNSDNMEIFSDFQGVLLKRFTQDVEDAYLAIERELKTAGVIC